MPMYNLFEYSDNYSDTSGSLWQFKRDEQDMNYRNSDDVTTAEPTIKYKSNILENTAAAGALKNVKIIIALKYLSNFRRPLEMTLINCKIHLEFVENTKIKITKTILYVPIVTWSRKGNVKLTKQLNEGFKRPFYWNEYKMKIESKEADGNLQDFILILLFKELKYCLFLLLKIMIMVIKMLKETVMGNIFFQV